MLAVPANHRLAKRKTVSIEELSKKTNCHVLSETDGTAVNRNLKGKLFQALTSGDFHPPHESPIYLFQIRLGDPSGGPMELVDPSRYIDGYQAHMIRSEHTASPIEFPAHEFRDGDAVVVDFMRRDSLLPDTGITSIEDDFSCQVTVEDRVVYALYAMDPPEATSE